MKGMESEHVLYYCYCMEEMSSQHACDCMKGMESEHVLHYCYCMKGMPNEHAL